MVLAGINEQIDSYQIRNPLKEIREQLERVKPDDLHGPDEHKAFIELVRTFRREVAEIEGLNGANYLEWRKNTLAVGNDSMYTNEFRFLFELIQNVDDCKYDDPTSCELNIKFDHLNGRIILLYNEVGFTPNNVFCITGIAEKAKNLSPTETKIGEKGIGFKSVFGVADKVLIQSGWFSFVLSSENFTVPEPFYNKDYEFVAGTRMTLFTGQERCERIYRELAEEYCRKDALFSKNPILFLNNLTKLTLVYDNSRSLTFETSKGAVSCGGDLTVENGVRLSVILKDRFKTINESVKCTRYTLPIEYTHDMYEARYGRSDGTDDKKMFIRVVIPDVKYIQSVGRGALYSFLPTQVKCTVPISCHIPFKLDSSREYVDDQNQNLWFVQSCKVFSEMMCRVYDDLSWSIKQNILYYLPEEASSFFEIDRSNSKLACLNRDEFRGERFLKLPILYTVNDTFKNNSEVYCFSHSDREIISDPIAVARLLSSDKDLSDKELFYPPDGFKGYVEKYGIKKIGIGGIRKRIFKIAIRNASVTDEALSVLDGFNTDYKKLIEDTTLKKLPFESAGVIAKHPKLTKAINDLSLARIRNNQPLIELKNVQDTKNIKDIGLSDAPLEDDDFEVSSQPYLQSVGHSCCLLDLGKDTDYLIFNNVLLLNSASLLNSVADFCRAFNKNSLFAANMEMRAASAKLNDMEKAMEPAEFLSLLREVRKSVKSALGAESYRKYIDAIKDIGTEPIRFLHELLQNADDVKYSSGTPSFKLTIEGNTIITEYNEDGFTNKDVRAITAIGESTKKKMNEGRYSEIDTIGEKGIGFKSVFSVCSRVDIHSGGFNFRLTSDEPTIPQPLSAPEKAINGTKMVFHNIVVQRITEPELLSMCLCLRRLKIISINGTVLSIDDNAKPGRRVITVGDKEYVFRRISLLIKETDEETQKTDSLEQKPEKRIVYYIPEKPVSGMKYRLYNGLPTEIETAVPVCIDAPFELDASRESIKNDDKNGDVRNKVYEYYLKALDEIKAEKRAGIFDYLCYENRLSSKIALFKNNDFLNNYSLTETLKKHPIIPTYNSSTFSRPIEPALRYYPPVIQKLLSVCAKEECPGKVIEDARGNNENKLCKLGCKKGSNNSIAGIIAKYAESMIYDGSFRKELYEYLMSSIYELRPFSDCLRNAAILPVKGRVGEDRLCFIKCNGNTIYTDSSQEYSPQDYWLLDTKELPKHQAEPIFKLSINELTPEYRQALYNKGLRELIRGPLNSYQKYKRLIDKFNTERQMRNAKGTLIELRAYIPLLTEAGVFRTSGVFVSGQPEGYYSGNLLKSRLAANECRAFAEFIDCKSIENVTYDDLSPDCELTDEDIDDLSDDSIVYGKKILEQCMFDGLIPHELIEKHSIGGLMRSDYSAEFSSDDFPNSPVINKDRLAINVSARCAKAGRIVKVREIRTVDKIEMPDGRQYSIDSDEYRGIIMRRYSPDIKKDVFFCQMCRRIKSGKYIEVNNIISEPKYYWNEMRLCLCLECSKHFEGLRMNSGYKNEFLEAIKKADVLSPLPVDVPIGNDTVRFTQTHLAEIQEILKFGKV